MDLVHERMGLEVKRFEDRKNTGDPDSEFANGQSPPPPTQGPPAGNNCGLLPDILCPDNNDRGRGNGNGNGNGNGDNNQGPNPGIPSTPPPPLTGGG
jgi:hypothetical protein